MRQRRRIRWIGSRVSSGGGFEGKEVVVVYDTSMAIEIDRSSGIGTSEPIKSCFLGTLSRLLTVCLISILY